MPWRPIFQVVDHRTHCLGQDTRRVEAELGMLFVLPPVAWRELFAMRRPSRAPQLRAGAVLSLQ